jgi:hypothetical protein
MVTEQPIRSSPLAVQLLKPDTLESVREAAQAAGVSPSVHAHSWRLAMAGTTWMTMAFLVCYGLVPGIRTGLSLSPLSAGHVLTSAVLSLPAFLTAMGLLGLLMMQRRPVVNLEQTKREPVVAAMVGGLLSWAILHNMLDGLTPFVHMGGAELISFVLANMFECSLFGVVLASLSTTRSGAFFLGASFQALFLTLSWFALSFRYV